MTELPAVPAKLQSAEILQDKLLIEQVLNGIVADERHSNGPLVFECMKYSVLSGGKRLRPLLGLQVARALGTRHAACLTHLAAVEILHTASLIIDDLPCMDNESVRRCQPCAHLQHGEGITILTAFALVALSIRLTEGESSGANTAAAREFKTMLLDSIGKGGLIAGQESDLTKQGAHQNRYIKTTPLFELACAAGMIRADLPASERLRILQFGRSYGRAFQAADDLCDNALSDGLLAATEVSKCSEALTELIARYPDFQRLREFVDFLAASNDASEISRASLAPAD